LDRLRDHHAAKHKGLIGPSRPSAEALAARAVEISDYWSALACGMCDHYQQAETGNLPSMLDAQKALITHIKSQHRNITLDAWRVQTAVKGLLGQEHVAAVWNAYLDYYGYVTVVDLITGLSDEVARVWFYTLRHPTCDLWLRENLPYLLSACVQSTTGAGPIHMPIPTVYPNGDPIPALAMFHTDNIDHTLLGHNIASMSGDTGPSTRAITTISYSGSHMSPMNTSTTPTTSDRGDAQHGTQDPIPSTEHRQVPDMMDFEEFSHLRPDTEGEYRQAGGHFD